MQTDTVAPATAKPALVVEAPSPTTYLSPDKDSTGRRLHLNSTGGSEGETKEMIPLVKPQLRAVPAPEGRFGAFLGKKPAYALAAKDDGLDDSLSLPLEGTVQRKTPDGSPREGLLSQTRRAMTQAVLGAQGSLRGAWAAVSSSAPKKGFKASHTKAPLHSTTLTDPYWFLLDVTMGKLVAILFFCYAVLILLGATAGIIFCDPTAEITTQLYNEDEEVNPFLISMMNTATSIITMGAGSMAPLSVNQFWLNTIMQLVGVIWNVLIFSVIVTRFQHPQHELVFSDITCTKTRDGVNTLVFRIGNRRGNYIFNPEVHLYVVSKERTVEGESFIKTSEVALRDPPPVISGIFNIVADVLPGTSLFDIVAHSIVYRRRENAAKAKARSVPEGDKAGPTSDPISLALAAAPVDAAEEEDEDELNAEKEYSLLVTMSGFDDTYQAEVRAFHKYWPADIFPNMQFNDAIVVESGKPHIDWETFHTASVIEVMNDRPMDFIARDDDRFTARIPPTVVPASTVHLFGLGDEVEVSKDMHLVGSGCTYSLAVEMLLLEIRVPYVLHVIQAPSKGEAYQRGVNQPRWFESKLVPKTTTPVLFHKDQWQQGTETIVDTILAGHLLQSSNMKKRRSLLPPKFTAEVCREAGFKYLNYEAYDEGSVRHLDLVFRSNTNKKAQQHLRFDATPDIGAMGVGGLKEDGTRGGATEINLNPENELLMGMDKLRAELMACERCCDALLPLESHLGSYPYCCGAEPGFDDFLRFIFMSNIFLNLAPLWGLDTHFYERCPNIHRWIERLAARPSCPFNKLGGHSREHFLVAFGDKYKKLLHNRYFSSHKIGLERDLVLEPSGVSPRAPPALYPASVIHVFGQGVMVDRGRFKKNPVLVGSLCPRTVALEMVLRELHIPYVLHVVPPTIDALHEVVPWFGTRFSVPPEGKNVAPSTPCLYLNGSYIDMVAVEAEINVYDSSADTRVGAMIAYIVQKHLSEDPSNSEYYDKVAQEVFDFSSRRCVMGAESFIPKREREQIHASYHHKHLLQTAHSQMEAEEEEAAEKIENVTERICTDLSIPSPCSHRAFEHMHHVSRNLELQEEAEIAEERRRFSASRAGGGRRGSLFLGGSPAGTPGGGSSVFPDHPGGIPGPPPLSPGSGSPVSLSSSPSLSSARGGHRGTKYHKHKHTIYAQLQDRKQSTALAVLKSGLHTPLHLLDSHGEDSAGAGTEASNALSVSLCVNLVRDYLNHGPADIGAAAFEGNAEEEEALNWDARSAEDTAITSNTSLGSGSDGIPEGTEKEEDDDQPATNSNSSVRSGGSEEGNDSSTNSAASIASGAHKKIIKDRPGVLKHQRTVKILPVTGASQSGRSAHAQSLRGTPFFKEALETCVQGFAPMEEHLGKYPYTCGDKPGADDLLRFSLLQPMLYVYAPLWGYDAPLFKRLPNTQKWCARLRERISNPFSKLYHRVEYLYATGLAAREVYSNRPIPDEALGLGLASLGAAPEGKANAQGSPVVKRSVRVKKKETKAAVSSNICV